jgi:hypothetical protein
MSVGVTLMAAILFLWRISYGEYRFRYGGYHVCYGEYRTSYGDNRTTYGEYRENRIPYGEYRTSYGENHIALWRKFFWSGEMAETTLEGTLGGPAHYGDGCLFAKAFASLCLAS